MPLSTDDLKKIFVEHSGLLKAEEFDALVRAAASVRRPFTQLLMERSFVSPRYFLELIGGYYGVQVTELKIADIDEEALRLVSDTFAAKNLVIPFAKENGMLKVAMASPSDKDAIVEVERATGMRVMPFAAMERAIKRALLLYKGSVREQLDRIVGLLLSDEKALKRGAAKESPPVVGLLDTLIEAAVLVEASDIHIEPFESDVIIRFRVDGLLRTVCTTPKPFLEPLIARTKVLAALRVDEHRLPQDGRFSVSVEGQPVDIRLSIVPSYFGEKAVMRILVKDAQLFDLATIGLPESDLEVVKRSLRKPYGMVLVCGPTGSGKTTTLYAFLQEIGLERVDILNISTVEDPIEYTVPRATQIQIRPDIQLTFAEALRALLRQDPDIIMVGEIRDGETADIAVRAALIGRLLLSSLHTNDAIGVIPRLLDMDVEPYLVSSTLSLVVAQRLVRKLCVSCRESFTPSKEFLAHLNEFHNLPGALRALEKVGVVSKGTKSIDGMRFFQAKGCVRCDHTGYVGRTAVFEILEVSDALRERINGKHDIAEMREVVEREGMKTLFADGLAKAILGVTDLAEVIRVTT